LHVVAQFVELGEAEQAVTILVVLIKRAVNGSTIGFDAE